MGCPHGLAFADQASVHVDGMLSPDFGHPIIDQLPSHARLAEPQFFIDLDFAKSVRFLDLKAVDFFWADAGHLVGFAGCDHGGPRVGDLRAHAFQGARKSPAYREIV
jgi:hypothetical protein